MTAKEYEKVLELKEKRISDWEVFGLVPENKNLKLEAKNILSSENETEFKGNEFEQIEGLILSDMYDFKFDAKGELKSIELEIN